MKHKNKQYKFSCLYYSRILHFPFEQKCFEPANKNLSNPTQVFVLNRYRFVFHQSLAFITVIGEKELIKQQNQTIRKLGKGAHGCNFSHGYENNYVIVLYISGGAFVSLGSSITSSMFVTQFHLVW
jgi:hypothetical protein